MNGCVPLVQVPFQQAKSVFTSGNYTWSALFVTLHQRFSERINRQIFPSSVNARP
jgi:hypothetical protein